MKHLLIIGNGLAGISAAIHAADLGCRITIASHTEPERSQSVMAGGGINAALNTKGENDSPAEHAKDTLEAGVYLADETAVREMTETAPALVTTLGKRGVVFSREADGAIALRSFGGQKKMRTAYAKSGIGKQLVAGMTAELRRLEAEGTVVSLLRRRFISPVIADGRCVGAVFQTADGSFETVKADAVIAASGGMGGLFDRHTGSALSDGSVTAALFVKGAEAANLEMIQYHPTTVKPRFKERTHLLQKHFTLPHKASQ